ncbi:MAG: hypothetical protein GF405_01785 [Candidatus Eisenbacteria bacterium]|nr:hypothetical protein [Candidatus Eisenbacteria bacterium]
MAEQHYQEQLAVIRSMVERTRRSTAESGRFFVWLGVVALVGVVAVAGLEQAGRNALVLPALIVIAVASGIVGYLAFSRAQRETRVKSYASTVSGFVWVAVGIANILVALVLPLIGAYDWNLVPILTCVVLGVGVFSTGAIFELPPVAWCAFGWWGIAVGMVFAGGAPRAVMMAVAIVVGWILPGVLFGRLGGGEATDA